jgi:cell division protein FtsQ
MVKKILTISTWVLSCLSIIALFAFARNEYLRAPVKNLRLVIDRPANGGFLEYKKTYSLIMKMTDSILGKSVEKLSLFTLKNKLSANPYISHVELFTSMDGVLNVYLNEREALVRVFDSTSQSAYIDTHGMLFPLNPDFSARVMVASGCFAYPELMPNATAKVSSKIYAGTKLNEIFKLAENLSKDDFLRVFVAQMYVDSLGEFELTPRLSNTNIVIGNVEDLDMKLTNLKVFFMNKAVKPELYNYKTISLKYKNQIVCIKRQVI